MIEVIKLDWCVPNLLANLHRSSTQVTVFPFSGLKGAIGRYVEILFIGQLVKSSHLIIFLK